MNNRIATNAPLQGVSLMLTDVIMSLVIGIISLSVVRIPETNLIVDLSPYYVASEDTLKVASSNILHICLDSSSQLFISNTATTFAAAELIIYDFIQQRVASNKTPYLWIKTDRRSTYKYYIALLDAVRKAEHTLANNLSIRYYGVPYADDTPLEWRLQIKAKIALQIVEEDDLGKTYLDQPVQ